LAAHIALSAENKELRNLREVLYPKPAKLLTVQAAVGPSETEALVDGGSQLNLISKTFVDEQKLELVPIPELLAEAANGSEIPIYGITTADVTITDSSGRKETHVVPFVVADLRRYQMYLGLPWIDAEDPKLNYAQRRLYLRGKKAKDFSTFRQFDIEDAVTFANIRRLCVHGRVCWQECRRTTHYGANAPAIRRV
jgi:hypothetical protein